MKKIAKIISRILLKLLAVPMRLTLVTFVIHRVKTSKELELLKEKGYYNPISVGDYSITERQMTSALENDNMVVFIDRAGYGLSDDTDNEMTLEYIVEDYRSALKNADDEFEKCIQDIIYPYAEKMGNCKVVLLPGDHAIYEQKPEECGKIVKEFIDGLGLFYTKKGNML